MKIGNREFQTKGHTSATLTSTMGPGVKLNVVKIAQ